MLHYAHNISYTYKVSFIRMTRTFGTRRYGRSIETYWWPSQWRRWAPGGWPWWYSPQPRRTTVSEPCLLFCWTAPSESTPATTHININTIYERPVRSYKLKFPPLKTRVPTNSVSVRFRVFTTTCTKMVVFWVVTHWSLVEFSDVSEVLTAFIIRGHCMYSQNTT